MEKSKLTAVAAELGTSRATVSKALNHCAGVSGAMRERILQAAAEKGLSGKPVSSCDIYVILPETPEYFWGALYEALRDALADCPWTSKGNLYSRMGDGDTVERYLTEAEELGARAILIAARYEGLDQRLARLCTTKAVFSICEPAVTNGFYFGSDFAADGRALASHCLAENPGARRILLAGYPTERQAGLEARARELGVETDHMPLGRQDTSAEIARSLWAAWEAKPFDAVICLDGIAGEVCAALKKCRLELPCYGFEHPPVQERYGVPAGELCQDLPGIARAAVRAAVRYLEEGMLPERKWNYVASRYRRK